MKNCFLDIEKGMVTAGAYLDANVRWVFGENTTVDFEMRGENLTLQVLTNSESEAIGAQIWRGNDVIAEYVPAQNDRKCETFTYPAA